MKIARKSPDFSPGRLTKLLWDLFLGSSFCDSGLTMIYTWELQSCHIQTRKEQGFTSVSIDTDVQNNGGITKLPKKYF